ncbi:hypothetical protein ACFC0D_18915 [Streptomyces sp. NPDC056222]|uniref:hypothetical protein n=1 Tax=Streptomyces sp. NPDC056222 TaxID=3345749 RepID=UPI0035DDE2F1
MIDRLVARLSRRVGAGFHGSGQGFCSSGRAPGSGSPLFRTPAELQFLGSWNNFLWPLVVAQNEDQYTLPVGLALVSSGQDFTRYGVLLAGAAVVLIPVLVVFLLFQRHFIAGIATTGLK